MEVEKTVEAAQRTHGAVHFISKTISVSIMMFLYLFSKWNLAPRLNYLKSYFYIPYSFLINCFIRIVLTYIQPNWCLKIVVIYFSLICHNFLNLNAFNIIKCFTIGM